MAHDGSKGPRPYKQTRSSTQFLRVPWAEWVPVRRGEKREFRSPSGRSSQFFNVKPPTPVVAYAVRRGGDHQARLMVLTEMWREPLGAISPESLAAEGCASLAEFRRRWMLRDKRRFAPSEVVTVYRVRPWVPGVDDREMADTLLEHLYGDWL